MGSRKVRTTPDGTATDHQVDRVSSPKTEDGTRTLSRVIIHTREGRKSPAGRRASYLSTPASDPESSARPLYRLRGLTRGSLVVFDGRSGDGRGCTRRRTADRTHGRFRWSRSAPERRAGTYEAGRKASKAHPRGQAPESLHATDSGNTGKKGKGWDEIVSWGFSGGLRDLPRHSDHRHPFGEV
jgi:hypothetical protein